MLDGLGWLDGTEYYGRKTICNVRSKGCIY